MVNTQTNIADVNEANITGVRALDSTGLVNIVEKMQEQGPWITAKGLGVTVTMCLGVRPGQIRKGATRAVVGCLVGDQDLRA
jgi:hypothetical protein